MKPLLEVEDATPTGTQRIAGFWSGHDGDGRSTGGTFVDDHAPTWPEPPFSVRDLAASRGLWMNDLVKQLGLRAVDVYGLQAGRKQPKAPHTWDSLRATIEGLPEGTRKPSKPVHPGIRLLSMEQS